MEMLTFWINAFIPKTVAGYTKTISKGTHAHKTAIPLPGAARVVNWNKSWNAGFLTDQRGFSSAATASVRMSSIAVFDLGKKMMTASHRTSGTTEVNIDTGKQLGFANADMRRCSFVEKSQSLNALAKTEDSDEDRWEMSYYLSAAAGDPLVNMAADIDYNGSVKVKLNKKSKLITLDFDGKLDAFPAFEAYAQYGSSIQTIFQSSPPSGNTVINLLGGANRAISGQASFSY